MNDNLEKRGRTQQGYYNGGSRIPMKPRKINSTISNFNNTMQSFASSKQSPTLPNEKSGLHGMIDRFHDARDSYQSVG